MWDKAEDVLGGLDKAAGLTWKSPDGSNSRNFIVHFAEAPCHGSDFHDLGSDERADRFNDMTECKEKYKGKTIGATLQVRSTRQSATFASRTLRCLCRGRIYHVRIPVSA